MTSKLNISRNNELLINRIATKENVHDLTTLGSGKNVLPLLGCCLLGDSDDAASQTSSSVAGGLAQVVTSLSKIIDVCVDNLESTIKRNQ